MTRRNHGTWLFRIVLLVTIGVAWPGRALAHCDGLDGPVVKAAQAALDQRNPALVLIWVKANDEPEIRSAFEQTMAVRALSAQARELADRFFFETVVRIHRAGEGAPYTGLKPAGRDLGPAIPAADKAIETGSSRALTELLTQTMQTHLGKRVDEVVGARSYDAGDLAAGRTYVARYVGFVHYVEGLYEAATADAHGDSGDTPAAGHDSAHSTHR